MLTKPIAAYVHAVWRHQAVASVEMIGSETDLVWADVRKLYVLDQCDIALYVFTQLDVLSSGHGESLVQIDPRPEVGQAFLLCHVNFMDSCNVQTLDQFGLLCACNCHATAGGSFCIPMTYIQLHALIASQHMLHQQRPHQSAYSCHIRQSVE